ncbi:type II toxin-antitoxin system PemK/MazF family toxin [Mucilaginibacter terrae]|uniref:type II toxin-antitoxin system PemK/MazF family toxin n=1 Tax=Mucilaginibacter terrae TaxID=1955052 RepID=UPI00362718EB
MLQLKQYDIWVADLNPSIGAEPGKVRPVVIIQSDVLHKAGHSSTIACVISSQPREGISLLRLPVQPTTANGLKKTSYILCDQLRAIDLLRLKEHIGRLDEDVIEKLNKSVKLILDLY